MTLSRCCRRGEKSYTVRLQTADADLHMQLAQAPGTQVTTIGIAIELGAYCGIT